MLDYYNATPDKIEIMAKIYMSAFSSPDDFLDANKGFFDYLKAFITDEDKFARIISVDGKDIGILLAMEIPSIIYGKQIYIDTIGIVTEKQNMGYGHLLIGSFQKEIIEKGYHCITLNTLKDSAAHQLYKKIGFKEQFHTISMFQMISSKAKTDIEKIEKDVNERILGDFLDMIEVYKADGLDDDLVLKKVKDYYKQQLE